MGLPQRDAALDALGNPVRRTILRILASGPLPVGEIASELPVSRPAVSKHLQILEIVNLVTHDLLSAGQDVDFSPHRPFYRLCLHS